MARLLFVAAVACFVVALVLLIGNFGDKQAVEIFSLLGLGCLAGGHAV
jgi:hypothetical protein